MNWTTPVSVEPNPNPIDYHSKIISIGSCFAENIAQKLNDYKFQTLVNPFGILFHPAAINDIILRSINEDKFTESDSFFFNDIWQSFAVHSMLNNTDRDAFISNLNKIVAQTNVRIREASHVIITYGTAWVYESVATSKIVANCHKVPSKHFNKKILSVQVIEQLIETLILSILKCSPNVQIIFTVSPVRHIKDGLVENQRSKSSLIAAVHAVLERFKMSNLHYFPSYEILMDELRDYRFYGDDLIHPSSKAVDYIWQRFTASYIAEPAYKTIDEVAKIQKALAHRPFHIDSQAHQQFLQSIEKRIEALILKFPHIKF